MVSLACRTASTRQQSSHYEWRGNGRPFVLFCFVFSLWYRILGIRLHIRPDHNCLLLTGELLVFHLKSASVRFTIRGRGCSRGKEDNGSWISHLIWAAREAWRTLMMYPEIACQGLPGTLEIFNIASRACMQTRSYFFTVLYLLKQLSDYLFIKCGILLNIGLV